MRQDAELHEGVKRLESVGNHLDAETLHAQLEDISARKEALLKQVSHLEYDIATKEKEISKAKWR